MPLSDCRYTQLKKIEDRRGNLTAVESGIDVPFDIKRVYYLYDVPGGSTRAGHAHKTLHQFFIAMSGSFDVTLRDGTSEQRFHMNRCNFGLYVPQMIWRDIDNFSSGAVCMVLASTHYDESDYFRDYNSYLHALNAASR